MINLSELNREELAERLILSVMSVNEKDKLLSIPHIIKGEIAVTIQLFLGDKTVDGLYNTCLTVNNAIFNSWNISKLELFEMAKMNVKEKMPVLIELVDDIARRSPETKESMLPDGLIFPDCLLLTNKRYHNGTAVLFYEPEMLDRLAKKYKTNELYIIPVSVTGSLCIPHTNLISKEECNNMLKIFSDVYEGERLSDKVYTYNSDNKIFAYDDITFTPFLSEDLTNVRNIDVGRKAVNIR